MASFLADENFDGRVLHEIRRRLPDLDIVRVQDVHLSSIEDPLILEWAAQEGRVLLTHDARTMPRYARIRIMDGLPIQGVVIIRRKAPLGKIVESLEILIEYTLPNEWENSVWFIPFPS
jgi:hypothetical protein